MNTYIQLQLHKRNFLLVCAEMNLLCGVFYTKSVWQLLALYTPKTKLPSVLRHSNLCPELFVANIAHVRTCTYTTVQQQGYFTPFNLLFDNYLKSIYMYYEVWWASPFTRGRYVWSNAFTRLGQCGTKITKSNQIRTHEFYLCTIIIAGKFGGEVNLVV